MRSAGCSYVSSHSSPGFATGAELVLALAIRLAAMPRWEWPCPRETAADHGRRRPSAIGRADILLTYGGREATSAGRAQTEAPVCRYFLMERAGIEPATSSLQSAPGGWTRLDNRRGKRVSGLCQPLRSDLIRLVSTEDADTIARHGCGSRQWPVGVCRLHRVSAGEASRRPPVTKRHWISRSDVAQSPCKRCPRGARRPRSGRL
jgi:hypothetical protein